MRWAQKKGEMDRARRKKEEGGKDIPSTPDEGKERTNGGLSDLIEQTRSESWSEMMETQCTVDADAENACVHKNQVGNGAEFLQSRRPPRRNARFTDH